MRLIPPPRRRRFYLKLGVSIVVLPILTVALRLLVFSPSPPKRDYAHEMEALLDAHAAPPADADRVWREIEGDLYQVPLGEEAGEERLIAADIARNGMLPGYEGNVAEYETEDALSMAFTLLDIGYPESLFRMPEGFAYPEAYERARALRWQAEQLAADAVAEHLIQAFRDHPGLRPPMGGRPFDRVDPPLSDMRLLTHYAYSRFLLGVRAGEPTPLADYLECVPPVARVIGNDGSVMGPLIAAGIARDAASRVAVALRLADLTAPDLARAQVALDEIATTIPDQAHLNEVGRLNALDGLDIAYRGHNGMIPVESRLIRKLILSHSAEHDRCDRFFDEQLAYAEHPPHERTKLPEPRDAIADKYELTEVLAMGVSRACWSLDQAHLLVDGACVMIALQRYRLRTGAYPASLEALVPGELAELPIDQYAPDGRLRYRLLDASASRPAEGYLLYSIGIDGADNGGEPPMDGKRVSNYLATSPGDDRPPGDFVFTLVD